MNERMHQATLLDDHWDALDRDLASPPPADLDPDTAALARYLVATLRPPAPNATFTNNLRQRLTAAAATPSARHPARHRPTPPMVLLSPTPPRPQRNPLAEILVRTTAAAVIIGLILATVTLLRGLPQRDTLTQPTAIATAQATATPSFTPAGSGLWREVGALNVARSGHSATLLPDGRVLVVGGRKDRDSSLPLASAEMFDPLSERWTPTAPLPAGRTNHAAALLRDGRVLVVGGTGDTYGSPALRTALLYDPKANRWSPATALSSAAAQPRLATLTDGTLLLLNNGLAARYDPATDTWTPTDPYPGGAFALTALMDGGALAFGGTSGAKFNPLSLARRYDPATNRWSAITALTTPRANPAAVALPDGGILAIGGENATSGALATAERYDPTTETWTPLAPLAFPRVRPIAHLLPDSRVLILDDSALTPIDQTKPPELYDPAANSWRTLPNTPRDRNNATVTLLPSGQILKVGGEPIAGNDDRWLTVAELLTIGPDDSATATTPSANPPLMGLTSDRTIAAPFIWATDSTGADYRPKLAPDDRQIAYLAPAAEGAANRLMVYAIASGTTHEIAAAPGVRHAGLTWSPDGQRLAYLRLRPTATGGLMAEVVVTAANLGDPRVIERHDTKTAQVPVNIDRWSDDGQRLQIGGRWVRVDGSGADEFRQGSFPCDIPGTTGIINFGAVVAPNGSATYCLVRGSAIRDPVVAAVPGDSLALIRQDAATGARTLVAPIPGVAWGVAISPNGQWLILGLEERRASATNVVERLFWPALVRRDGVGGLQLLGGDPHEPRSDLVWTDGDRAYFTACPSACGNAPISYLYALDAATATVHRVGSGWEAPKLFGTTRDGRFVLLLRPGPQGPELHLVEPAPASPDPRGAIPAGPIPVAAYETLRGLMAARIAGDTAQARRYLTPNGNVSVTDADLVPTGDQAIRSFLFWFIRRDSEGKLHVTLTLNTASVSRTQTLILEADQGQWPITYFGPIIRPPGAEGP